MATHGMWVQPQQVQAQAQQQGWQQPLAQQQGWQQPQVQQQGWQQGYAQPQQQQASWGQPQYAVHAPPGQAFPPPHHQPWNQPQQHTSPGVPWHAAAAPPPLHLWVVNDSKKHPRAYRITVDRTTTLRDFTRCLQHKSTYGVNKASMRLKTGRSPTGPWYKFFSFRFMTKEEKAMYDRPLVELGLEDDMWLQLDEVMSGTKMAVYGVSGAVALPIVGVHVAGVAAASGAVAAAGTVALLVGAKLAIGWGANKTFKYVTVKLAPELPPGILEILEVHPADA